MMDKVKKQEYIDTMTSQFDKSEAVIVTEAKLNCSKWLSFKSTQTYEPNVKIGNR